MSCMCRTAGSEKPRRAPPEADACTQWTVALPPPANLPDSLTTAPVPPCQCWPPHSLGQRG
eukprot:5795333-Prorocentrum_lima.AAC.1